MDEYLARFRDPIHGSIHLSTKELKLVDSSPFRRLRNIKQLALTYLVYPGAMHTRFEHSLGVMELATRAFDAIAKRFKGDLTRNFTKLALSFDQAKALLRATALLHDVGHLPFSHAAEEVLPKGTRGRQMGHEDVSVAIIRNTELSRLLRSIFYSEIVEHVCLLLDKDSKIPPELLILKKLISSQFDADRMDYLSRDSHHCGVGYGNFDYLRLLETLRVKPSETGGLELSIERGGLHTIEAMILARYWMYTQVYFQKTRRIYDIYLARYFRSRYSGHYRGPLAVLDHDDLTVMGDITRDARAGRFAVDHRHYAWRIKARQHHRVIYDTGYHASAQDKRVVVSLHEALKEKYASIDLIVDQDARGSIHGFYVKDDEEMGEEFPVYDTVSKGYSRISEESRILDRIPKNFHAIRIYADVPKETVEDYRDFAKKKAKELKEAI